MMKSFYFYNNKLCRVHVAYPNVSKADELTAITLKLLEKYGGECDKTVNHNSDDNIEEITITWQLPTDMEVVMINSFKKDTVTPVVIKYSSPSINEEISQKNVKRLSNDLELRYIQVSF